MEPITSQKIMSKDLITVRMGESLIKAHDSMLRNKIRHLPVLDDHHECVGIISDRDIQRAMKTKKHGIEMNVQLDPKWLVQDFMSWPALVMSDAVGVLEITERMLKDKISACLISSAHTGGLRGIITTDDLLKLLAKLLRENPNISKVKVGDFGQEDWMTLS